jgi:hypothetical protein
MASTVRMLSAGLALAGNTFALIMYALVGGAIFTPISAWYAGYNFSATPSLNPSLVQWIFPAFFGLLLILEVVLIYAVWQTIFSKKTYYTDQGY